MIKKLFLFLVCVSVSGAVVASPPGWYAGAQYAALTFGNNLGSEDVNLGALVLRGGFDFNPNFSVEARYGFGLGDDNANGATIKLDSMLGAYAIGKLPLGSAVDLYGVLGYTRFDMTFSNNTTTVSSDGSDLSFGVGADLRFGEPWSAGIEYMNYYDKNGEKITALSIGASYRF